MGTHSGQGRREAGEAPEHCLRNWSTVQLLRRGELSIPVESIEIDFGSHETRYLRWVNSKWGALLLVSLASRQEATAWSEPEPQTTFFL